MATAIQYHSCMHLGTPQKVQGCWRSWSRASLKWCIIRLPDVLPVVLEARIASSVALLQAWRAPKGAIATL